MTSATSASGPVRSYTVAEVADLLRVSERSVRREIVRGHLGCVRIGRAVRITEEQLRHYIEEASHR